MKFRLNEYPVEQDEVTHWGYTFERGAVVDVDDKDIAKKMAQHPAFEAVEAPKAVKKKAVKKVSVEPEQTDK